MDKMRMKSVDLIAQNNEKTEFAETVVWAIVWALWETRKTETAKPIDGFMYCPSISWLSRENKQESVIIAEEQACFEVSYRWNNSRLSFELAGQTVWTPEKE